MAFTSAAAADPAEGKVIANKYRLESLLGEGGMGAVWRAYNLQLEVPVAVKLLRASMNAAELGERLRVEARAAAKLVHPSIVRVFDIGEAESGEPFIVMELLQGQSLSTMLESGPLSAVNALQLMLPIGEALSLAHSRGVVHRDLKPDNIFIAHEGACLQPKLLDFGIAKVRSTMAAGGPTLTRTGTLLGSPEYMSPEQAHGRSDIDERSDIWAFCVVLYEVLSGRTPFESDTCQQTLYAVVKHDPSPLEWLGVDPQLAALIYWGLAKDRDARPGSMFELGRELAAWLFARGVLEDAAGSSLEAKWLGRSNESVSLTTLPSLSSPRAQHEHATLVSVVHPSPRPSHESIEESPVRPERRWLKSAMMAGVALTIGLGWASMHLARSTSQPARATAASELRAAAIAAPAVPAPVVLPAPPARVEAVTVDSLAVATTTPSMQRAVPKPYITANTWSPPAAAMPAAVAPTARDVGAPRALPQALPDRESELGDRLTEE